MLADALLAATLLTHDVHRLATFDAADFALFEPLLAFAARSRRRLTLPAQSATPDEDPPGWRHSVD